MFGVTPAEVAELADAQASGACGRKAVGVRVPPSAPVESVSCTHEPEGDGTSGLCDAGTFDGTLFPLKCGYGILGHCLHVPIEVAGPFFLPPRLAPGPAPRSPAESDTRVPSHPVARNLTSLRGKPDRTSREKKPHRAGKASAPGGKHDRTPGEINGSQVVDRARRGRRQIVS